MTSSLPTAESPPRLVDLLLAEQRSLTAVERFSTEHQRRSEERRRAEPQVVAEGESSRRNEPAQARYYRDLMPVSAPAPGQQYAFEVDLDSCSGCKACVVACHNLNGLQQNETWRNVGLLSGGSDSRVQHVTTACHHCVAPGCLAGCPVRAYDKDPETGIVRHLDDQCIGCKYCTMMCPYEVPQYSESLGIVRKCDMCHQRLSAGEAPACVQSCPNGAISITLVEASEARQWAAEPGATLVPQAPSSQWTVPTTRYLGTAKDSADLVAQDRATDRPAESHWPLAAMLVLTQVSLGLLIAERLAMFLGGAQPPAVAADAARWTLALSLFVGGVGLNLAALHLGRPLQAWRVFLGLRTSWLSREAIVFGKFAGLLALATALAWLPAFADRLPEPALALIPPWALPAAHGATIVAGVLGVYCSGMIYIATRRRLWRAARTLTRFYATAVTAGLAAALPVLVWCGVDAPTCFLTGSLAVLAVAGKTHWERRILLGKLSAGDSDDVRSQRLAVELLPRWTSLRLTAAVVGAAALVGATAAAVLHASALAIGLGLLAGLSVILGEFVERLLYFSTVVYDRMPRTVS